MASPRLSKTDGSTRRLSEVARHVVIPKGVVTTGWPRVEAQCAEMGVAFDAWQRGLGSIAFGKRKNGKYAANVGGVTLSIPRQVGKTFWVGMVIIALCVLYPKTTVLWTAHRTRTATKTFTTMQGYVRRKKIAPHLLVDRSNGIRTSNGEQEIKFRNGSVVMFGARADGFGRGFDQVDFEVFDEAQILDPKALEDMIPAMNQATHPAGGLAFFMGTPPRPGDKGEHFAAKRSRALDGKATDHVYVEMSAEAGAEPDDQAQWAVANPSFPHRTQVEAMERMREEFDDDDSFRREALGIWDAAETARVIDDESWRKLLDEKSVPLDRLTLAIDVDPDRKHAAVAVAGLNQDGLWHIQLEESRPGTVDWVIPYVTDLAGKNKLHAVVADQITGLIEDRRTGSYLIGTNVKVTAAKSEGMDMADACAKFYDQIMVAEPRIRRVPQPALDVAVSVARKRKLLGGAAWAWNRRDANSDITPLVAATLALWGAQNDQVKRPQKAEPRRVVVR